MIMKVRWSRLAVEDIRAIRAYIGEHDTAVAQKTVRNIISAVNKLIPENLSIGRAGRVSGTREMIIARTPFTVPYRVHGQSIHVLRVYHTSRRWPEKF